MAGVFVGSTPGLRAVGTGAPAVGSGARVVGTRARAVRSGARVVVLAPAVVVLAPAIVVVVLPLSAAVAVAAVPLAVEIRPGLRGAAAVPATIAGQPRPGRSGGGAPLRRLERTLACETPLGGARAFLYPVARAVCFLCGPALRFPRSRTERSFARAGRGAAVRAVHAIVDPGQHGGRVARASEGDAHRAGRHRWSWGRELAGPRQAGQAAG